MIVLRVFMITIVSSLLLTDKCSNAVYNISISLRNNTLITSQWTSTANFTLNKFNTSNTVSTYNGTNSIRNDRVDCFGLGATFTSALHWFFFGSCTNCNLDVRFFMSSRKQPYRVEVLVGQQFGLEWTNFLIERRTVVIVHGFLSHSGEAWIKNLENAFLLWDDVNVIIVDWSAGGNSWNYYRAVVNTRIVGRQITRFLGQIVNATLTDGNSNVDKWGPLHLVGHSLGAHICGFVCHNFKNIQNKWVIKRVTGLDPAQPCFTTDDLTMKLDRTDAEFVDVIHTNGRLFSRLGLGLPTPVGHADFYPNGGMKQPGCVLMDSSFFNYLPISNSKIKETICSHGRSYVYLTESLISAVSRNCTFWAHHWDMTYRDALRVLEEKCAPNNCSEMGIRSEENQQFGTFYVATAERSPFCVGDTAVDKSELIYLVEDLAEELDD